jgi:hypothetical protein
MLVASGKATPAPSGRQRATPPEGPAPFRGQLEKEATFVPSPLRSVAPSGFRQATIQGGGGTYLGGGRPNDYLNGQHNQGHQAD